MFLNYLFSISLLCPLFVISVSSLRNKNEPCVQIGVCKCEFPSGVGVDLTLLRGLNFSIPISINETLHFYPCKNVNVTNSAPANKTSVNECSRGASLCLEQFFVNDTKLLNLGTVSEARFDWKNLAVEPLIVFNHSNRTLAEIRLKCSNLKTPSFKVDSWANNVYKLELSSENACTTTVTDEGRSVFSTFFLICLVLFVFYFLCGFLVLKCIRGAQGWEAIPHGEFWKSLWTSFKNMCVYFVNGCQQPGAYDSI